MKAGPLAAAALLVVSFAAVAAPRPAGVAGKVTSVIDGDTLQFTPTGKAPVTVRLRDIDAPEICQEWGVQAQRALADIVLSKPALLQAAGSDGQGRTLGVVWVDEINVGQQMVEDGNAWSVRTRYDQGPLVKQERMAKALARGFHTQAGKVTPWEFRKTHGPCGGAQAPGSATAVAVGSAAPSNPAPPAAAFRCDGRTHCSQMHSCEEAKYFLAHCPGVKMDGNRDGVPCAQQWCRR